MLIEQPHPWTLSTTEAKLIQQQLRHQVVMRDELGEVQHVAGVDVGFDKQGTLTRAAVVVLKIDGLTVVEQAEACVPTRFPYVPGYLSFREMPAICKAFEGLNTIPDVVLCDGQGLAHPRRFGIACHLGVLSGLPCIGVGKSRLIGHHGPVPERKGDWVELTHADETIGAVLRTREKVNPIFVSVGHKITLATAVALVMRCVTRYRLPETTRHADRLASRKGVRAAESTSARQP